jgi:hydrogenase small subunit
MNISRRIFLKYCGLSAGALGLNSLQLGFLADALASPTGPSVIWLQGSACAGCSVSLLNRISDTVPHTIADTLTDHINLIFHPTLTTAVGETTVAAMKQAVEAGPFVLVVEGGIPTAFGGHACVIYSYNGQEVTMEQAVQEYAPRAAAVVCVGTCSSFGGIPAAGENPTGVVGVRQLTGRPTINIPGCPANPNWMIWAIVQLILGNPVPLDSAGRPIALYQTHGYIHDHCPRNQGGTNEATDFGQDGKCLIHLGCRGPLTQAKCENCWNGKEGLGHWCIGANAPCQGCVEPNFPGPQSFFDLYIP